MRTISNLIEENEKRVYVYLADEKTSDAFICDAEREGICFCDGVKLTERPKDNLYALNKDKTVNFIGYIGRVAFQCNVDCIVRIDYKKYINGNGDYLYRQP